MPNLNIKDDLRSRMKPQPLTPFKKQPMSSGRGKTLPVLVIVGAVILIAVGVYLLSQFGYIKLWEKKVSVTNVTKEQPTEIISPPDESTVQPQVVEAPAVTEIQNPNEVVNEIEKKLKEKTTETATGEYAIFIYSFRDKTNAVKAAQRWTDAGYISLITEKDDRIGGKWYRVSIGRFETKNEALKVAQKLSNSFDAGYVIDRLK